MTVRLSAEDDFFRKASYHIQLEKDGFYPQNYTLRASIDPWYFGNFIFPGLIGFLLVDPISGDMWELDDDVYLCMTAKEEKSPAVPKDDAAHRLRELKKLKEQDILTEEEYKLRRDRLLQELDNQNKTTPRQNHDD